MRFYTNFPEAIDEIRRELKEMGIRVKTASVQNINIVGNEDYGSYELQNYTYTITSPQYESIPLKNPEWANAEFNERVSGEDLNPGKAYLLRADYWEQFLNKHNQFDYAYPERMYLQLDPVLEALKKDPNTRRAFLPIYDASQDDQDDFKCRLPCSLGYWFNYRQDKLNMTYLQRSSDFGEHFNYDIYLACRLKDWVAAQCNMVPGMFTHWLGSLHVFSKDVTHVF